MPRRHPRRWSSSARPATSPAASCFRRSNDLAYEGLLPERYAIVGSGGSRLDDAGFRERARGGVEEFSRHRLDEGRWRAFARGLSYVAAQLDAPDAFGPLRERLVALDAVPLGAAFLMRSQRAERYAGLGVVLAIFVSACVAGVIAVGKIINPQPPDHLLALAIAGVIGCLGNEVAAQVRLRSGRSLDSPALVADGYHARTDGIVSLGVLLSAVLVALGFSLADPIIAIVITVVILRITVQSWHTLHGHTH